MERTDASKQKHAATGVSRNIPEFQPGDTIIVNLKTESGDDTHIFAYEGVCVSIKVVRRGKGRRRYGNYALESAMDRASVRAAHEKIDKNYELQTVDQGLQRVNAALRSANDQLEEASQRLGGFLAESEARVDGINRQLSDTRTLIAAIQAE